MATVEQSQRGYSALLRPYEMAGVRLKNRVVMAGHGTRFVGHDTHHLSDQHIAYMTDRARGGVGAARPGQGSEPAPPPLTPTPA